MWLLTAKTLDTKEFIGSSTPLYALLSHTWGNEEVSFQDVQNLETTRKKKGFAKIQKCCNQALAEGLEWVWIDTCCIDKSSSVELSEAINSMWAWYRDSCVCYAFLEDVSPMAPFLNPTEFENARWFKRGWCLQELIAPAKLEFYASDWSEMGTKLGLRLQLQQITGIPTDVLLGVKPLPLLYGEGSRAFLRLQEQILAKTADYSLLLWTRERLGVRAEEPDYENLLDYRQLRRRTPYEWDPPLMTARGLRVHLYSRQGDSETAYIIWTGFMSSVAGGRSHVCVRLWPSTTGGFQAFGRASIGIWKAAICSVDEKTFQEEFELTTMYLKTEVDDEQQVRLPPSVGKSYGGLDIQVNVANHAHQGLTVGPEGMANGFSLRRPKYVMFDPTGSSLAAQTRLFIGTRGPLGTTEYVTVIIAVDRHSYQVDMVPPDSETVPLGGAQLSDRGARTFPSGGAMLYLALKDGAENRQQRYMILVEKPGLKKGCMSCT
ncbi:heterokaryon incompatibility protein-domain-containing protein [Apodospora peruviana]|uniref:Heterokaryon incompatibility protein-domain-containing protein n=1 Tax=Apodospora peruviana TaxID=516989 RepID=A0AAE0IU30_9PEZI|nr:heterokaryon incompatibility protein-domain-containing protein [Apodospora peruviana]